MATPAVSNTLLDGQTIQPGPLNQNFADIVTGLGSGGWDLTISALTVAGTMTIGGNATLGNSVSDKITMSGTVNSDIVPSSSAVYSLGTTSLPWKTVIVSVLASGSTAQTNSIYGNILPRSYGKIGSQATIMGGFNIASCNRVSTGVFSITMNAGFNQTSYVCIGSLHDTGIASGLGFEAVSSSAIRAHTYVSSGSVVSDIPFHFVLYGN